MEELSLAYSYMSYSNAERVMKILSERKSTLLSSRLIIFMTVFIDVTGFGIVLPLLPYYASEFGAGSTALGLLVASFALMQFIFTPLLS